MRIVRTRIINVKNHANPTTQEETDTDWCKPLIIDTATKYNETMQIVELVEHGIAAANQFQVLLNLPLCDLLILNSLHWSMIITCYATNIIKYYQVTDSCLQNTFHLDWHSSLQTDILQLILFEFFSVLSSVWAVWVTDCNCSLWVSLSTSFPPTLASTAELVTLTLASMTQYQPSLTLLPKQWSYIGWQK